MSNSKCVRSIKALKHYKRYRSAMIASVLVLSGIVFLGDTAEAMPGGSSTLFASIMYKSGGNSSSSSSSKKVKNKLITRNSTSTPGKVIGNQDLLKSSQLSKKQRKKLNKQISYMKEESDRVIEKTTENGTMLSSVPVWSWSKELLESLEKNGKLLYQLEKDGTYTIFYPNV